MSRLGVRAEVAKLCHVLGVDPAEFVFLRRLPAEELYEMRRAAVEGRAQRHARAARWIAVAARRLPGWLSAWLCEHLFGPPLVALVAGELPARLAVPIANHLSIPYMAAVSHYLDPRRAHDLIQRMPVERIVEEGRELIRQRDYITVGRFVDFLPDAAVAGILERIDDDEHLLRASFFVESKNRLDHIVRLLPLERLRRAILLAVYPERDVLIEVMSLVVHVSYGLQRELGDLAAEQDDAVLDRIVHAAQVEDLWADILPVLANLSVKSQMKLVDLPVLREEPEVLERILRVADAENLWYCVLPLYGLMREEMKDRVAEGAAVIEGAMARVCEAALIMEHWQLLADVVARLPRPRQELFAEIVCAYGEIDPDLMARVAGYAEEKGFGAVFRQPLAAAQALRADWVI